MLTRGIALSAASDLLLLRKLIIAIEHTASTIVHTIGFCGSRSQSEPRNATASQQPKTKPDDAFKILGCCETLRDNETYRRGSQRNDDIEA